MWIYRAIGKGKGRVHRDTSGGVRVKVVKKSDVKEIRGHGRRWPWVFGNLRSHVYKLLRDLSNEG